MPNNDISSLASPISSFVLRYTFHGLFSRLRSNFCIRFISIKVIEYFIRFFFQDRNSLYADRISAIVFNSCPQLFHLSFCFNICVCLQTTLFIVSFLFRHYLGPYKALFHLFKSVQIEQFFYLS